MKRALVLMAHPNHGGIMRSLGALAQAGPRFGWELDFVFPSLSEQVAALGLGESAAYIPGINHWRRLSGRLRLPAVLGGLAREARRRGARLIYSATLSTFPYALLAARVCGIEAIVHAYSSYGDATPYHKYWLGHARHAIFPSRDSLERATGAVGCRFAGGADVVYNGVDVARVVAAAAERPEGRAAVDASVVPTVGMVAYMDRRKNPMAVVEMTARIARDVPDLRVLLVGSFPDRAYREEVLERARELGVSRHLRLTGFQVNPFPVVNLCDVIVLPTRRDPFPIALLEAMALGKPVVASAVGGIPEMIADGDTGFVVPADDVARLADRVRLLLQDGERREAMGRAALERLRQSFSLDGFVAKMFAVFETAAAKR